MANLTYLASSQFSGSKLIGGKCADDYIEYYTASATVSNWKSGSTYTLNVSSLCPVSDCYYEIEVNCRLVSANTANARIGVTAHSASMGSTYIAGVNPGSASNFICCGTAIIQVPPSDRNIYLANPYQNVTANGTLHVYVRSRKRCAITRSNPVKQISYNGTNYIIRGSQFPGNVRYAVETLWSGTLTSGASQKIDLSSRLASGSDWEVNVGIFAKTTKTNAAQTTIILYPNSGTTSNGTYFSAAVCRNQTESWSSSNVRLRVSGNDRNITIKNNHTTTTGTIDVRLNGWRRCGTNLYNANSNTTVESINVNGTQYALSPVHAGVADTIYLCNRTEISIISETQADGMMYSETEANLLDANSVYELYLTTAVEEYNYKYCRVVFHGYDSSWQNIISACEGPATRSYNTYMRGMAFIPITVQTNGSGVAQFSWQVTSGGCIGTIYLVGFKKLVNF